MGHFHAQDHVSAAGAEADVFLAALKDRSDRGSKSPSSVTAHSHAQGNSAAVNKETNGVTTYDHYDRSHEHLHSQPHTRSHLHLLNPFAVHSHAKGHEFGSTAEADADADALLAALKGRGHRGFNITLLGLLANIPLSTSKDLTGVYLNSAATTRPAHNPSRTLAETRRRRRSLDQDPVSSPRSLLLAPPQSSASTFSFHQPQHYASKSTAIRIRQPSGSALFAFYPATTATAVSRQASIDNPPSPVIKNNNSRTITPTMSSQPELT
ncbi:hypothetical protein A4X03_0g6937 [Tilletia caries]|uniref:Uncharacterized protein n=1 Tax=Tilletia caries TaxID=13290 RepID=A0A8T8STG2_9BASI|nr:hypothetical protein A4X03_0g6937 [Tilletia caries]